MVEPAGRSAAGGSAAGGSAETRSRAYALGGLALGSIAGVILASVSGAGGPAGVVLAAAALAGLALALILRHVGRRVLGVVLALLGIGMLAGVVTGGLSGVAGWGYALCGLLVLAGSVLMVARAQRWPRRPDRFDRRAARAQISPDDDPNEVWQALDAGHDPTTAAGPDDSGPADARQ